MKKKIGVLIVLLIILNSWIVYGKTKDDNLSYDFKATIVNQWENKQQVQLSITNTGMYSIENWSFRINLNTKILNIWNANKEEIAEGIYLIKNVEYNQDILPGESVQIGFIAEGNFDVPQTIEFVMAVQEVPNSQYQYKITNDTITIINCSENKLEDWILYFETDGEIRILEGGEIVQNNNDTYIIKNLGFNANIDKNNHCTIKLEHLETIRNIKLYQIVVNETLIEKQFINEEENEEAYIELEEETIQLEFYPLLKAANKSRLSKSQLISKLDEKFTKEQKALKIIRKRKVKDCVNIVLQYDAVITNVSKVMNMPKELVQSVLFRELACLKLDDDIADNMVINYYSYQEELEIYMKMSWYKQLFIGMPSTTAPMKTDSSTGLGQIFAKTAILANNYLYSRKIIGGQKYNYKDWKSRKAMWYNLKNNNIFNIRFVAYILRYEAWKLGISNINKATVKNLKKIMAKYNGDDVYGDICYEYYKIFKQYN